MTAGAVTDGAVTAQDLWSVVLGHTERHPDRIVLDFDGTTSTWQELVDAAERCAAGLAAAGIERGDIICHLSPNDARSSSPRWR